MQALLGLRVRWMMSGADVGRTDRILSTNRAAKFRIVLHSQNGQ